MAILGPGDVFGDVPLLVRRREPFDAKALEDSLILSLDANAFFELLARRPGIMRRWILSLAERMSLLQDRVGDILAGSLEQQIASLLLHSEQGSVVTMSQETVADLLGARRSSVNRVLKAMEAAGLIVRGYRRIDIRDRIGLEETME